MPLFATVTELGELMGETLTGARATQAEMALELASIRIQSWTRQRIEAVVDDIVVLYGGPGTTIELPEQPVTAVGAITIDGTAVAASSVDVQGATLYRDLGWGTERSLVSVTYSHGYAPIPDDIRGATLQLALRVMSIPVGGITSESIGGYSVTYDTAASFEDDLRRLGLGRYRRSATSVRVGVAWP